MFDFVIMQEKYMFVEKNVFTKKSRYSYIVFLNFDSYAHITGLLMQKVMMQSLGLCLVV